MKFYIKTDENNKVSMIMRDRHPKIDELIEIDIPEEEFFAVSADIGRYVITQKGMVCALEYTDPTAEELSAAAADREASRINTLRKRREQECFSVINRGQLWLETLTEEQIGEIRDWYHAWLDVTLTGVVPVKPSWI